MSNREEMDVSVNNEKKYRILQVHNYYQIFGGEDTVVANEKKLLEDNGHIVIQYTRSNNELKSFGIFKKVLLPFASVFNLRTYWEIKKIIHCRQIDIVHVHNTLTLVSPAVYYAALHCKVPVVQTIHNFRLLCPGASFYRDGHICEDCLEKGLGRAIKYKCYRNSRAQTLLCVVNMLVHRATGIYKKLNFICLTEFNKEKIIQLNNNGKAVINARNIYIKPNFTYDFCGDKGERPTNYYLYIGRVEKIKGIDLLIEAFQDLKNQKLIIVGMGSLLDSYKGKNIGNIEFKGFLEGEDLKRCIGGAKAVIVPSQWYETFGMVIIEAYAAQKPVIVGDVGNIAELVEEGVTGMKFKYDSVVDLKRCVNLFESMDTSSWRINAYRKYKKEFAPQYNYKMLRSIYEHVADRCKTKKGDMSE